MSLTKGECEMLADAIANDHALLFKVVVDELRGIKEALEHQDQPGVTFTHCSFERTNFLQGN
jgi:hypothetical protein